MKNKIILKRMVVMLLIILIILGGINLFWYFFKYYPYKKMSEKMQFNDDPEMPRYGHVNDQFMFRMKQPSYLAFQGGFLYVCPLLPESAQEFVVDEEGNMLEKNIPHADMFIWPQMFSETKYGVTVYEETSSYQLMINRQCEFLPDTNLSEAEREALSDIFQKHKDEIQELLDAASDLWGDDLR